MLEHAATGKLQPNERRHEAMPLSVNDYIFNKSNLDKYRDWLLQGLAQVQAVVATKPRPFSGVLPHELADLFQDVNLDHNLDSVTAALAELQQLYLDDAVYFHHPHYVAHLNCPVVVPALLAELILSSINSSLDTWDQSAGATLIEQRLVDWTCEKIGYTDKADGIFTSGGTQSNLMALLLARERVCEREWGQSVKQHGLPKEYQRLRIFTSELSHFSVQKSAAILGLGYDSVIAVATDKYFCMDAQALAAAMARSQQAGEVPLAVVATAGTTDFGSIDPLPSIADVCAHYRTWLHVDAAYGGGLLVSSRHRHWLNGIERADSVTVDYHKSFFQPVSCGAFFARDKRHLNAVTYHAEYLNPLIQQQEGTPNLVDKSLQTTRRFDALKLWLTLRTMGAQCLGDAFDRVIHLARQTHMLLLSEAEIEVLHRPQLSSLVFRYQPLNRCDESQLNAANRAIRKALARSGEAMIAATKVEGRQYLKFTLLNPTCSIQEIHTVIKGIKHHGEVFFKNADHAIQEAS